MEHPAHNRSTSDEPESDDSVKRSYECKTASEAARPDVLPEECRARLPPAVDSSKASAEISLASESAGILLELASSASQKAPQKSPAPQTLAAKPSKPKRARKQLSESQKSEPTQPRRSAREKHPTKRLAEEQANLPPLKKATKTKKKPQHKAAGELKQEESVERSPLGIVKYTLEQPCLFEKMELDTIMGLLNMLWHEREEEEAQKKKGHSK
ncbi:hypothetical protein BU23DRAFT_631561 [Bimuria novae-zelandiae CBS 107.79]|uniref:Uncharacterized protein n=1 Tax=Bimuria novae-zelandiae CBS 107.79 TaxID=1447943 RepID=A0A6A5UIA5_9PLEO|nr:hypothetical protein BU23DRAFT_631561 [Bimuria novae-zelandiae CBS 107.79]